MVQLRSDARDGDHDVAGLSWPWRLLVIKVEFPVPALTAADLHVVVCRVLCPVTCAPCWAALCTGESNPALPAARQEGWPDCPPARSVHASAAATCSTPRASLHEVELPVGLLDPNVSLAYLPGQVVRLGPELRNGQGGEHFQLGA